MISSVLLGVCLNRNVLTLTTAQFDLQVRYGRPAATIRAASTSPCATARSNDQRHLDYGVYAVLMTSRGERANDPDPGRERKVHTHDGSQPDHWQLPGTKF